MTEHSPVTTDDFINNRCRYIAWGSSGAPIVEGDTFLPQALAGHSDKTVHFFGTFGGATIELEGSNDPLAATDPGSASWVTLKNAIGTDLSATDNTLEVIIENPIYIRPKITGGSSVSLQVVVCARIVR